MAKRGGHSWSVREPAAALLYLRWCVFALMIVGLLWASSAWPLSSWGIARYDALLAGFCWPS